LFTRGRDGSLKVSIRRKSVPPVAAPMAYGMLAGGMGGSSMGRGAPAGTGGLDVEGTLRAATMGYEQRCPFTVVYHPRLPGCAPFLIPLSAFCLALLHKQHLSPGAEFRSPFEADDFTMRRLRGVVAAVGSNSSVWPLSQWRSVKVSWSDSDPTLFKPSFISPWDISPPPEVPPSSSLPIPSSLHTSASTTELAPFSSHHHHTPHFPSSSLPSPSSQTFRSPPPFRSNQASDECDGPDRCTRSHTHSHTHSHSHAHEHAHRQGLTQSHVHMHDNPTSSPPFSSDLLTPTSRSIPGPASSPWPSAFPSQPLLPFPTAHTRPPQSMPPSFCPSLQHTAAAAAAAAAAGRGAGSAVRPLMLLAGRGGTARAHRQRMGKRLEEGRVAKAQNLLPGSRPMKAHQMAGSHPMKAHHIAGSCPVRARQMAGSHPMRARQLSGRHARRARQVAASDHDRRHSASTSTGTTTRSSASWSKERKDTATQRR
ncbi:hypothetical protein CLOP_g6530, partial [Closterium sp. NIES-67]